MAIVYAIRLFSSFGYETDLKEIAPHQPAYVGITSIISLVVVLIGCYGACAKDPKFLKWVSEITIGPIHSELYIKNLYNLTNRLHSNPLSVCLPSNIPNGLGNDMHASSAPNF